MIDVQNIDTNVRAITEIENSWGLPPLPDMAKLDIASLSPSSTATSDLLYGIRDQLSQGEAPVQPDTAPEFPTNAPSGAVPELGPVSRYQPKAPTPAILKAQKVFSGFASLPAPTVYASDSVEAFKQRAVDLGYLDAGTAIDPVWSPELNTVRWQMARDDFSERIKGNRPGAVSLETVSKFMDDWLSPTGLLRAAMDLDFVWDPNEIGREWEDAGSKWQKFLSDASPGNFWDAMTSSLDLGADLILPVVNTGLLLTGVGQTALFARVAYGGVKGAEAVRGLYGVRRLIQSADIAADVAKFGEASFLSTKLAGSSRTALQGVAKGMDAWRGLPSVQVAKKGVQQGMRLGLASRLEDTLVDPSGKSLSDVAVGGKTFGEYADQWRQNPAVYLLGEMAFTPPTLLEPGSIGVMKDFATDTAKKTLWMSGIFEETTNQSAEVMTVTRGYKSYLAQKLGDDAVVRFEQAEKTVGPSQALADELTGGSLDQLGALMGYVKTAAAIDASAMKQASAILNVADPLGSVKGTQAYHLFRNKLIAQIRHFDPDNVDDAALMLARTRPKSNRSQASLFKKYKGQFGANPDMYRELVSVHNGQRRDHMAELLGTLDEGTLEAYLPRVMDHFGKWGEFNEATDAIMDALDEGLLDAARFADATGPTGARLRVAPDADAVGDERKAPVFHFFDDPTDMLEAGADGVDNARYYASGMYKPLARAVDPSFGKFTVASKDTLSKQDMLEHLAYGRRLQQLRKSWSRAIEAKGGSTSLYRQVEEFAGTPLTELSAGRLTDLMSEASGTIAGLKGRGPEHIKRIRAYLKDNPDMQLEDLGRVLSSQIDEYAQAGVWAESFGIPSNVPLPKKMRQLANRAKFTAAEVDPATIPDRLRQSLEDRGYKLVHGVEYMMPQDLREFVEPFQVMSRKQQRTHSLGMFFGRQEPDYLKTLNMRRRREVLRKNLRGLERFNVEGFDSADVEQVLDDLNDILRKAGEEAKYALDRKDTQGIAGRIFTNLSNGITPMQLPDLSNPASSRFTVAELAARGYEDGEVTAVMKSLKEMRSVSLSSRGLVHIEDHLRANPNLTNSLRLLGRTEVGSGLGAAGALSAKAGVVAGRAAATAAGGALAYSERDLSDGVSAADALAIGSGLVAGRAAGGAAVRALSRTGVLGDIAQGTDRVSNFAAKWDSSKWARYAYLADNLAYVRDYARFTLSPIFDASRYTEGTMLAQIAELPDGVTLRANQSPTGWRKMVAKELRAGGMDAEAARKSAMDQWKTLTLEFSAAARGDFEFDTLEDTSRWFNSVGILGYNPTEWMASTFGHLRRSGVDPEQAYDTVRKMYTYGTTGRSAAELSMNFVFFPFSFQKKALGHLSQHLAKDMSRAVFLHDSLKTYEILNEKYDLESVWRDHLPALEKLNRFNLFAYGISPGELGGQNRPLIDAFTSTPAADGITTPVMNLFLPQAVEIKTKDQLVDLQSLTRRLAPVINDVGAMVEDLQSQQHVLFGGSWRTKEAEITRGYEQYNELRSSVDQVLKSNGVEAGWRALNRLDSPAAQRLQAYVAQERARIARENPEWERSKADTVANRVFLNQERENRINAALSGQNWSKSDTALLELSNLEAEIERSLSEYGISLSSNPDDVPPEVWLSFRARATELVKEYPGFERDWIKFFRSTWGPLEKLV